MSETQSLQDDEIDLRELFLTLWRGKIIIFLTAICAVAGGSAYLHRADRLYTVSVTVQPTGDDSSGSALSGLGGLASLAGVSLPSGGGGEFESFSYMLTTPEIAETLLDQSLILQFLFQPEWDNEQKFWRAPEKSQRGEYLGQIKRFLTGSEEEPYRAPDTLRLASLLDETLSRSRGKDTGFLTLSADATEPKIMEALLGVLVANSNDLLRKRYLETGRESLSFYQTQIARARSSEHREALARLIAQEEQKLMLANRGAAFAAQIVSGPVASIAPTSPKSSLVLALAAVLGVFLGCAIVLLRAAMRASKRVGAL